MIAAGVIIFTLDIVGSMLMMVAAILCFWQVNILKKKYPNDVKWTFFFRVCFAIAAFAVLRSTGNLLEQVMLVIDRPDIWELVYPLSGSINLVLLMVAGSVTLCFERSWKVFEEALSHKPELRASDNGFIFLNQNMEKLANERPQFLMKDNEQQLTQTDKLMSIGRFSAGIAHEINNPLGIILGYTQLLLRGEDPESEKYQDLKTIEKHVRTCKSIVEDLLNFSGRSKTSRDVLRLNEVIEEVISCIRQYSKKEQVEIIEDFDPSIPSMILDEKKIRQVFMNLIVNAIHAVGKNGTIMISTRHHANDCQAVIRISDTGYGIEEKNLLRIFDPFFTTKPTGEGTGLGLSVSYGIIKSHGGNISVESKTGKGTTVTVILPVHS